MALRLSPPKKVSKEELSAKLSEILSNPQFAKEARRQGQIARFAGGPKRGADLLEHVLEVGDGHLVPLEHLHPWWQSWSLDLLLVGFVALLLLMRLSSSCGCARAAVQQSQGKRKEQ